MLEIWSVTWASGVIVHFAAWETFTRKQAIATTLIQLVAALLLARFAEVLAPAWGILIVNSFHIVSFLVAWWMRRHDQQIAHQKRAETIGRLKKKWHHLL